MTNRGERARAFLEAGSSWPPAPPLLDQFRRPLDRTPAEQLGALDRYHATAAEVFAHRDKGERLAAVMRRRVAELGSDPLGMLGPELER